MKQANTHITLLLGPQTRLALALNDVVRTRRDFITAAGVTAIPNRITAGALRAAVAENLSDRERDEPLWNRVWLQKKGTRFFCRLSTCSVGQWKHFDIKSCFQMLNG